MANDIVTVLIEDTDVIEKDISFNEFLTLFNYEIRTNEEDFEFIYFPAGCLDYTMSVSLARYSVVAENYAEHYGLKEDDCRYYLDITFSLDGKNITEAKVYSYDSEFNRIISNFTLIAHVKDSMRCESFDDGIRYVLAKRNSLLYKVNNEESQQYSKIKQK